jgi:hypothetical protein
VSRSGKFSLFLRCPDHSSAGSLQQGSVNKGLTASAALPALAARRRITRRPSRSTDKKTQPSPRHARYIRSAPRGIGRGRNEKPGGQSLAGSTIGTRGIAAGGRAGLMGVPHGALGDVGAGAERRALPRNRPRGRHNRVLAATRAAGVGGAEAKPAGAAAGGRQCGSRRQRRKLPSCTRFRACACRAILTRRNNVGPSASASANPSRGPRPPRGHKDIDFEAVAIAAGRLASGRCQSSPSSCRRRSSAAEERRST